MLSSTMWLIIISGAVVIIIVASVIIGSLTGRVKVKDSSTMSSIFNVDKVSLTLCAECNHLASQKCGGSGSVYICKKGLAKPSKASTIKSSMCKNNERYPCNTSYNEIKN